MSGFDESKHPRDSHGRFSSTGGGSNRSMQQRMHRELGRRAHTGEQHMLQPDGSHAFGSVHGALQTRGEAAKQRLAHLSPAVAHNLTTQRFASRKRATAEAQKTTGLLAHNPLAHAKHARAQKDAYDISKDPTRGNLPAEVGYALAPNASRTVRTTRTHHTPGSHTIHSAHRRSR